MAKQIPQPPELEYAATPSFAGGLTPAQEQRFRELDAKFGNSKPVVTEQQKARFQELEAKFGAPQQAPVEQRSPFMQRMQADFEKRKAQVATAEAAKPTNEYGISKPLQVVGANLGLVSDAIGNVAGSGARYAGDVLEGVAGAILPDEVSVGLARAAGYGGEAAKNTAGEVLNDSLLARGIKSGVEGYQQFAKENPEMAANIGAVGNIAINAPLAKPVAAGVKLAGEAAIPVVKGAAKAAAAPVKATARNITTGMQGIAARDAEALAQTAKGIREASSQSYKQMRDLGAVLNRNKGVNIANNVESVISKTPLNKRLHGDTISVLNDFKARARDGDLGLEELDQYRQLFSDVVRKNTDVAGGVNADGMLASKAIRNIDDSVAKLGKIDIKGGSTEAIEALNTGRATYAKARKFEQVADIIKKADGDPNKIKSGLKSLMNNPKKLKGFSPAEFKALQEASRQTATEGVLKSLGKFGFDLGNSTTFGNTALPVIGGYLGTPALTAAGTAARAGQKYLARGKAEKLLKTISGETPK